MYSHYSQSLPSFLFLPIGLNYKKLTDKSEDALEALEPVLTSQNILSISKLALENCLAIHQMAKHIPQSYYTLQQLYSKYSPKGNIQTALHRYTYTATLHLAVKN